MSLWLEPEVEIAASYGMSDKDTRDAYEIIIDRLQEILDAWEHHFGR
jgi:hypothetical protein